MNIETQSIPSLLKAVDVSKILNISRTESYRLLKTGAIPSVRFGTSTVRVLASDLEQFITKNRTKVDLCE